MSYNNYNNYTDNNKYSRDVWYECYNFSEINRLNDDIEENYNYNHTIVSVTEKDDDSVILVRWFRGKRNNNKRIYNNNYNNKFKNGGYNSNY